MGLLDIIFGEGPSQTTTTLPTLIPEQEQALKDLLTQLSGEGPQIPQAAVPPQLTAIMDLMAQAAKNVGPITQTGQQAATTILGGGNITPTAQDMFPGFLGPMLGTTSAFSVQPFTINALQDIVKGGPQDIDEYFRATVGDPMLELYNETLAPEIRAAYAPSGFWSGQRLEAEARGREDLLDTLSQERTRMSFEARENALERAMKAALGLGDVEVARGQTAITGAGEALRGATNEAASRRGLLSDALRMVPDLEASALRALNFGAQGTSASIPLLTANLTAENQAREIFLRNLLNTIGQPAFENIIFNNPGRSGLLNDFLGGSGPGALIDLL